MPSASTSDPSAGSRLVSVSWERIPGWIERYDARHPGTSWSIEPEQLIATSPDGSSAAFYVPFPPLAQLDADGLAAHLGRPWRIGVVLVRKGGFAVARLEGPQVVESKVGRRHVQSRSKAGGWSQQRFARRRDNQAQAAYTAAAGHVVEILLPDAGSLDLLVSGGDRQAVDAVLSIGTLRVLRERPSRWLPGVAEPRRPTLDAAIVRLRSVDITVTDSMH